MVVVLESGRRPGAHADVVRDGRPAWPSSDQRRRRRALAVAGALSPRGVSWGNGHCLFDFVMRGGPGRPAERSVPTELEASHPVPAPGAVVRDGLGRRGPGVSEGTLARRSRLTTRSPSLGVTPRHSPGLPPTHRPGGRTTAPGAHLSGFLVWGKAANTPFGSISNIARHELGARVRSSLEGG